MFRSIVAGSDGFDRGREAVAFAASLADAADAKLFLVAAYLTPPLPFPASHRQQSTQVDAAIRRVRDELAPRALTVTVDALSAAHALRHVAAREHADLIVVGSHDHAGHHRLLDPDHALQVLHAATTAVAVVPDGCTVSPRLQRIAVGFDGSPESRAALTLAADLARRADAELRVEHVVEQRRPSWASDAVGFDWMGWQTSRLADGRRLVEEAIAGLSGVRAEPEVASGDPARTLADAAMLADLLVLGSRRSRPLSRLALGSTSERVVRHAARPVLVLPWAAEKATGSASAAIALTTT
jgi:nucleotide-binding universal stress UspA family protein